jgi:hypothetical protein
MTNRFFILRTCSALWLLLSVACDRGESGSGQTGGAASGGMQSGGIRTATGTGQGGSGGITMDAGTNKPDAMIDAPLPVRFTFRAPGPITWENPVPSGVFRGIWGSSPNNIYAVGSAGNIQHYQNGQWNREVSETQYSIEDVWGSGPTDVYAAVDANIVLRSTGNGVWVKHVYSRWQGQVFNVVWGTGPNNVYLGGAAIYRSTGSSDWVEEPMVPASQGLQDLWGPDPQHIYGASWGGVIQFSSGNGIWSRQPVDTNGGLMAVWGSDPNNIFVGGTDGLFYSTGDGKWEKLDKPASDTIEAIVGVASDVLLVAGGNGGLYYLDQYGKLVLLRRFDGSLRAAWSPGPGQILVVGGAGVNWGRY